MPVEETLDLNLSSDRAQKLAGEINDQITQVRAARGAMDNRIAGYWERYEAKEPARTKAYAQEPNIRVPLTMWLIDNTYVRIMRTIYGQLPYIRVTDEDRKGAPESLPLQTILQHLNDTDLAFRFRGGQLMLNGLVEGTAVGKITRTGGTPRRVRDRRPAWQRVILGDALIEQDAEDGQRLAYDVLDLKDFWVAHPAMVDLDRQPWVAHRVWLSWEDVVSRQRDGRFTITRSQLDEIKPFAKSRRTSDTTTALDDVKTHLDRAEEISYPYAREYEFAEVEWRTDVDGDERAEEVLLTVLMGWNQYPMSARKMPFWNGRRNYVIYRPLPRTNRFYGRAAAGIAQPLQDEADARLNQDLSAGVLDILLKLTPILPLSAKREWENHKWNLLKPIFTDDPAQFRTLSAAVEGLRQADFNLDRLFAIAERTFGLADPQLGKPSEGSKTAFEISQVVSEGNIKFSEMIEQLQFGNTEYGYQVIEHAYQLALESPAFANRLQRVAETDPFAGTSMAEIRKRWGVRPVGNTLIANREVETRKRMAIYQLFKDDPFVNADPEHAWHIRKTLLDAAGLEREVSEIIGSPEELKAFRLWSLQQRAAQGDLAAMALLQSEDSGDGQAPPLQPNGMPMVPMEPADEAPVE